MKDEHANSYTPAHQRLAELSAKHLHRMLEVLHGGKVGGSIGFDACRNPRTATKEACAVYIRETFEADDIDAAHREVIAFYRSQNGNAGYTGRGRRSKRRAAKATQQAETATADTAETAATNGATETTATETATTETATAETNSETADDDDAAIAAEIAAIIAKRKASIDPDQIREIVRAEVKAAIVENTVTHKIQPPPPLPPIDMGAQHKHFPLLLNMCNARDRAGNRLNVWLHGEASSGKSRASENVATALGLPFYCVGALDQAYKLIGYRNASGEYVSTTFRQAWEHGGVFLLDEYDGSHPSVSLELNSALASGEYYFPDCLDRPIKRHADCIIIAAGNTAGQGATAQYNGRQKQDAANLTRFVFLEWQIDEGLERATCGNADWVATVQRYRKAARDTKLRGFDVSTRATYNGEALLAAGMTQAQVIDAVIRCGLSDADWRKVEEAAR